MAFRATRRAALLATVALLAFVLVLRSLTTRAPFALAALGMLVVVLVACGGRLGAAAACAQIPSDARIARFIEERKSELDERLVSAVGVARATGAPAGLAASMVGDAARAASADRSREIVASEVLRRAGIQAVAALLAAVRRSASSSATTMRQSYDAVAWRLFPAHVVLEVTPGDARVQAGSNFTVEARLVGNQAPVVAQLLRSDDR